MDTGRHLDALLSELAADYAALEGVLAVVQGGSITAGNADEHSDIDLYVYSRKPLPLEARREVARRRASYFEVGNTFAESGDEWLERVGGVHVDVMFRRSGDFENHLTYLLEHFEARQGYSTAVWHNLRTSRILFDPQGWFAHLQEKASQPYPQELARAIIRLNLPRLRGSLGSREHQIGWAVKRQDLVAVNQTLSKLLDGVFDVLFALNRTPHPGEKRLLKLTDKLALKPPNFVEQVETLLGFNRDSLDALPAQVDALLTGVFTLLEDNGERPPAWGERP